jgi:hypothetical protein
MKNKSGSKHEILLGLTTTPASDWRGKVGEMKKFGIKRIALFPTFLSAHQRKELYKLLEDIDGLKIPHVHLRAQDMEEWEMKWFQQRGTEVFNIHMGEHDNDILKKHKDKIYVENHVYKSIPENQLKNNAGICLDFQHWQRAKKGCPIVAENTQKYAEQYHVGCCHMSALPKWKNKLFRMFKRVSGHYMCSLDEMDYLKNFIPYFPKLMSIELENSFAQQMKVKAYLEKLLNL